MANLATYRANLASTLAAAGRVVYAWPNENITPPAIVLVPGSPYITVSAIGGARCNVRFDITCIVNAADNQAALANLETLILHPHPFREMPCKASANPESQGSS